MKKTKIAILISGRGTNMKALIEASKNEDFPAKIVLVLSNKADAKGLEFAQKEGIKTSIISHKDFSTREEFDKKMHEEIINSGANFICLAGFMRLVSPWFVRKWPKKMINIHPSYLPDFKGANAVEDALKSDAKTSGCTVHYVIEEMDAGEIILQEKVEILENDTKEILAARILETENKIYPQALKKAVENLDF